MNIRDRIINSPELQPARAARDLDALVAGLNAQAALTLQPRFVTMRTITSECDDANGVVTALIKAAAVIPVMAEMLAFLRSDSGMDVGHPRAQAQLDAMATAGILSPDQAQALKNLALQPRIVSRTEVEAEFYNPDGTEK